MDPAPSSQTPMPRNDDTYSAQNDSRLPAVDWTLGSGLRPVQPTVHSPESEPFLAPTARRQIVENSNTDRATPPTPGRRQYIE